MIALHPQYVIDERGARLAVMLPANEYDQLLSELEMADDVAAYDRAKELGSDPMPLDSFVARLDQP